MKVKAFEYNMFGVNTYLVWDPESLEAAIVDPGMISRDDCDELDRFIKINNLRPVHLINTHLHIDHTFGEDYVKDVYGLAVEAGEADAEMGRQRAAQARRFGINVPFPPVEIDTPLRDGDKVWLGNAAMTVLEVPGHSPGSIALLDEADGWVITGDVLFRQSIGRTDLAGGNHRQLLDSIASRLMTLPDATVVYPGHGPSTTIGHERLNNPFLR